MILLALATTAWAHSCCTSVGAQPSTLASCDRLGVAFGVGGDVETGGWSWSGAWSPVGDDGGGDASASVAIMGRAAPWLQAGLRMPLTLSVDRLDGVSATEVGLGNGLVWVDVETPAGWPSVQAPTVALELGFGSEGPSATSPGATVVQGAVRLSRTLDAFTLWGNVSGRVPVIGVGVPDGDATVVVDHTLGGRARLGLGLGVLAAGGGVPGFSAAIGPSLVLTPAADNQLLLSARAGLPVPGIGRNAPSRFMISLDWYRALAHTR